MSGTSWLLGAGYPWFSAEVGGEESSTVIANATRGLSLATLPRGPFGLLSSDGSLGRLGLPIGVAVDRDDVFVLSTQGDRVWRWDPVHQTLVALPHVGAEGLGPAPSETTFSQPRRFLHATQLAALANVLYVADAEQHRIQVFDTVNGALLRIHEPFDDPVDVATGKHHVYVLDRARGRVYRTSPTSDSVELAIDMPTRAGVWSRLVVDRDERLYLLDAAQPGLDMFVLDASLPRTLPAARYSDSADVRDRFVEPQVQLDADEALVLSERLANPGIRRQLDASDRRVPIGDRVYVIDTRRRLVRVELADGRTRHGFGPYDARGANVPLDGHDAWAPADIIAFADCALILDERHQVIYAHRTGSETLARWFSGSADSQQRWRRMADDGAGCLLLWDGASESVDRVDPRGKLLGTVRARDMRSRFLRPSPPARKSAPMLTRVGTLPRPKQRPRLPQPAYETRGVWTSAWLDSDLYHCTWHLLELEFESLPPGSRVVVHTRTSNQAESEAEMRTSLTGLGEFGAFSSTPAFTGPPQPETTAPSALKTDVLVQSAPGQFLQLRIEIEGTGLDTPVIGSLRLRFPRESLLQYLPAIYSKVDESRDFLDGFLSILQTTWSAIEERLDTFERYLDPDSVPVEAMGYLASWLDLRLEGTWTAQQNRQLLRAMPELWKKWGTVAGLRSWLRVYLSNLSGVSESELERAGIPGIVEGFVDRRRFMLGHPGSARLGASDELWSPSVERRFQLGVFDQEGEVELVSPGAPELDFFRHSAHWFRVYVPAAWVGSADDEALLRRAIELQKPAHTSYELVLVEPRFRIGEQSTLDLDTVIGAPLPALLAYRTAEEAAFAPPVQRLGFDMTLGCADAPGSASSATWLSGGSS